MTDEIDELLREYSTRWSADQPPPPPIPALTASPRSTRRRWLPAVAVVVGVLIAAPGVALTVGRVGPTPHPSVSAPTTATADPTADQTADPVPTFTFPADVVPWAPLPPSNVVVASTTTPVEPSPPPADSLPPCSAQSLTVIRRVGAAMGTSIMSLGLTASSPCRLGGFPTVTAIDAAGQALDVPTENGITNNTPRPVAVTPVNSATLVLTWSAGWCADEITIAAVRVALPDGAGSFTVDGFGRSTCNGTPASGEKSPIRVMAFNPPSSGPAAVTAFHNVPATILPPGSVRPGARLPFTVQLVAANGVDVSLATCPDYEMSMTGEVEQRYALNCAGVPYRDPSGRPYLPAGKTVSFAMQLTAPTTPGRTLIRWQLVVADPVPAGASLSIE